MPLRRCPARAAAALAGGLLALVLAALAACAPREATVRRTEVHMGTVVTITASAASSEAADSAIGAAFAEIARLDDLLSNYRPGSEVSLLNRDQALEQPSPELLANLRKSIEYGELTGGAFDITVQPILDLYDRTFGELHRPPTPQEVRQALQAVDYRRIRLEPGRVSLGPGQEITLGGIAKGYAVDRAIEVLLERGVRSALVDAGGDLRTVGRHEGRDWIVAVRDPRNPQGYIDRLGITDRAVVTSGDYERYYNPEKTFHHIVDPHTGYSPTRLISVTIAAADAFDADALSTSVFVLGPEEGMRLIESLPGVEGLLVTRERQILRSSGWSALER